MTYDFDLQAEGLEASLGLLEGGNGAQYRHVLEMSLGYLRKVRDPYTPLPPVPDGALTPDAQRFSEILTRQHNERLSPTVLEKVKRVQMVENDIEKILSEVRSPTEEERIEIATMLYATAAADWWTT